MFDVIIRNGIVIDGTGAESRRADIGITGERIAAIGDLSSEDAEHVIDAAGRYVTPGFIDPHTHVDNSVMLAPHMENYIKQGVTTVVTGNCGHCMAPIGDVVLRGPIIQMDIALEAEPSYFTLFPMMLPKKEAAAALKKLYGIDVDWTSFGSYLEKCDKLPLGANMAPLAGYSAIRNAVMGSDCNREATDEELKQLAKATEECMEQGAFGLSTGRDPQYTPGPYATIDEMTEMLKITASYGGIFASHTYNYNKEGKADRMGGYREMLDLGKAAGIRTHVSHVHLMNMAKTPEEAIDAAHATLELFEEAEREGLDLSYDIIPNPCVSDFTVPYFALYLKPLVLMSGTRAHLAENFKVPDFRDMVRTVVKSGYLTMFDPESEMNWFDAFYVFSHKNSEYVGKSLSGCAELLGMDKLDAMMHIFSEDPDMGANLMMGGFEEAHTILCRHRMASPCSDGMSFAITDNLTNMSELPAFQNASSVSCMEHYLVHRMADEFECGVRQASGQVAERFGIADR